LHQFSLASHLSLLLAADRNASSDLANLNITTVIIIVVIDYLAWFFNAFLQES
jgi:hypothetical protein